MSVLSSDNFVRADSNSIGSDWSMDLPGASDWDIENNKLKVTAPILAGDGTAAVNVSTSVPLSGYSVHLSLGAALPVTGFCGVLACATYSGSTLTSGYAFLVSKSGRAAQIVKFSSFPTAVVLSEFEYEDDLKRGDTLSLEVIIGSAATSFIAKINQVEVSVALDESTPLSTGYPGILVYENSATAIFYFEGFVCDTREGRRPSKPRITHYNDPVTYSYQVVCFASEFSARQPTDGYAYIDHVQSRWQVYAPDPEVEGLIQDTGWVSDMLTTAFFNDVDPTQQFAINPYIKIRVKYRDQWGHDTPWSSFLTYQLESSPVHAPHSTIAPFPDKPGVTDGFTETQVVVNIRTPVETGKISRVLKTDKSLKVFAVPMEGFTRPNIEVYWKHFKEARGKDGIFVYRHPLTSRLYTVRYVRDSMSRTMVQFQEFASTDVVLREVT